jgi:phosphatidylinositol alpha-1,6-mannosyltransferase
MNLAPAVVVPLATAEMPMLEPERADNRFVLFVGRIVPRKGARWFVENVLPLLPADIQLYVVGKPWDREETEALKRDRRVRLFGYVPDDELAQLKRRCLAMIMPNIRSRDSTDVEGFGIVAVEAAAQGIPIVVANIEGLSDAVRDRETGFLVESGDAEAWRKKIVELAAWSDETRRAFAAEAHRGVARHYSWGRVADDTVAIYRRRT